jgi:hypothetical protein
MRRLSLGKLLAVPARFLLLTVGLFLVLLIPTEAFVYGEAITVTPSQGPGGQVGAYGGHALQKIRFPPSAAFTPCLDHRALRIPV